MADRKAFIVVRGRPSFWFPQEDDGNIALDCASQEAADKALEDQEDYTVLQVIIPDGKPLGLTARYHGVVMHAMEELSNG